MGIYLIEQKRVGQKRALYGDHAEGGGGLSPRFDTREAGDDIRLGLGVGSLQGDHDLVFSDDKGCRAADLETGFFKIFSAEADFGEYLAGRVNLPFRTDDDITGDDGREWGRDFFRFVWGLLEGEAHLIAWNCIFFHDDSTFIR